MTNILVTGCGGFIGSHIIDSLLEKNVNIYGTVFALDGTKNIDNHIKDINVIKCDLKDKNSVINAVKESSPDIVFHMAAQSFVVPSWESPENTLITNILGTLHLFEALNELSPGCKVQVACSSAEYGTVQKSETPIKETGELRPSSPYAVSKVGQDMLSYLYHKAYDMNIIRIRFFNITGPRKTFDACSDFSRQIAEIENGKRDKMIVGNLEGLRDITDVRDAVRALHILNERGTAGEVYNICSGKVHRIGDLLEKLLSLSNQKIDITKIIDTKRKIDDPLFLGDNKKIASLGWHPIIPIERTLEDMMNYWRNETTKT